jgi:hypothetical protein
MHRRTTLQIMKSFGMSVNQVASFSNHRHSSDIIIRIFGPHRYVIFGIYVAYRLIIAIFVLQICCQ